MPLFSAWVAKNAKLEVQDGAEWWRFPGLSGVTKNQDPATRETIPSWDGDIVVVGSIPPPTLDFAGTADFLHRAMLKAEIATTNDSKLAFRLRTYENSQGPAISGDSNTMAVVRNDDTKFGTLALSGKLKAVLRSVGAFLKQGTNFYKIEEIAEPESGTNGYDGTDATGVVTMSKYSASAADRKDADPTQEAVAVYSLVLPSIRVGPFNASVSAFNDLTQDGATPFNFTMTLSPDSVLPTAVIHV